MGKHLTYTNRLQIEAWLKAGVKVKEIAKILNCCRTTIYNEIKRGTYIHRNSDWTEEERYSPELAEKKIQEQLRRKGPDLKIGNDYEYAAYIEYKISVEKYSPDAVLGEIKAKGLQFNTTISRTTLYRYIDCGVFLTVTNDDLPSKRNRKKKKYHKVRAKRLNKGLNIEQRDKIVDSRSEFGHWEMDCVVGPQKSKAVLLVLTERYSRYEIIERMKDKTAKSVEAALNKIERRIGKAAFAETFKTITADNGSEFSDYQAIERSVYGGKRTSIYFCHPYSAYERGSNENANKLIRRHCPKGTDFARVTIKEIKKIQAWINNYPREIFNFFCANDVFKVFSTITL